MGIPPAADATVVGLELVLGVPPKITATASGSVAFLDEVLTARHVAPTLFLSYHFGDPGRALRPCAGIGINYTRFTDVKTPYG